MIGIAFSDESEASALNKKVLNRKKYAGEYDIPALHLFVIMAECSSTAKTRNKRSSGIGLPSIPSINMSPTSKDKEHKEKKKKKGFFSKALISAPSSFKHIAHMGFDSRKASRLRMSIHHGSVCLRSCKGWAYPNPKLKKTRTSSRTLFEMQRRDSQRPRHHLRL